MSDEDEAGPLTFATTDELIEELMSRYHHALFAGIKEAPGLPDHFIRSVKWKGNFDTVAGLGTRVGLAAIQEADDENLDGDARLGN